MLSSKFSFSIDVRSKIRHVFAIILNIEKRDYKNNTKLLETRKNDSYAEKPLHSFFSDKWLIDIC